MDSDSDYQPTQSASSDTDSSFLSDTDVTDTDGSSSSDGGPTTLSDSESEDNYDLVGRMVSFRVRDRFETGRLLNYNKLKGRATVEVRGRTRYISTDRIQ